MSVQAWFRPYDPESAEDRALLIGFAREFYRNAYGSTDMLDEDAWMADTDAMAAKHDRAVTIGMVEDQPVALVRMNVCDESEPEIGKVGSFEAGYEFDALVIDDAGLPHPQPLTPAERLERVVYLSDDRHISGKYVAGARVR